MSDLSDDLVALSYPLTQPLPASDTVQIQDREGNWHTITIEHLAAVVRVDPGLAVFLLVGDGPTVWEAYKKAQDNQ